MNKAQETISEIISCRARGLIDDGDVDGGAGTSSAILLIGTAYRCIPAA
jgi:hypothetical protein